MKIYPDGTTKPYLIDRLYGLAVATLLGAFVGMLIGLGLSMVVLTVLLVFAPDTGPAAWERDLLVALVLGVGIGIGWSLRDARAER